MIELINEVEKNNITIDEFIILYNLYARNNNLNIINTKFNDFNMYLELEEKLFIKSIKENNVISFQLRLKGSSLIESFLTKFNIETNLNKNNKSSFDEFWTLFPSSDETDFFKKTRFLKSNKDACKKKYLELLNQYKHEDIIKALKYEVETRKNTSGNGLKFMKNSLTWLNQKEFEIILENLKENIPTQTDWTTNSI